MSIIQAIIRYIRQRCDDCGSELQGEYAWDPMFGYVRTCCARAAQ